ncbi:protein of unknown function [Cyanobium sp. NIES-981]|nr:protein of unknown function [Cyanobium sp. NIES-981]
MDVAFLRRPYLSESGAAWPVTMACRIACGLLVLMACVALVQSYWLWRRGWFQDWTALRR